MLQIRYQRFPRLLRPYQQGYQAGRSGRSRKRCPYPDHRTGYGGHSFSRLYRAAWMDGYEHGQHEKEARRTAKESTTRSPQPRS